MKRKGQVYILAAILIAIVLFGLAAVKNRFEQKELRGDFEAISENFDIESSRLINSAVEAGVDVHEAFRSFNTMFTAYAKGKNPNYGLVYVLDFDSPECESAYGSCIQIGNFWDEQIVVQGCDPSVGGFYSVPIGGCFENISANLNFEGFDIKTGVFPASLNFSCGTRDNPKPCCTFVNSTGPMTELAISIGGVPYYMCVKKGIPELMVVGLAVQENQTQVSSTGECVGKDFCNSLISSTACQSCGQGICCWWNSGSKCLSQNVEVNKKKCFFPGFCDILHDSQRCWGSTIYWVSSCDTKEEDVEKCASKKCRDWGDAVCPGKSPISGIEARCCDTEVLEKICDPISAKLYDCTQDCGTVEGSEQCERHCEVLIGDDRCCMPEASVRCGRVEFGEDPNIVYWVDSCGNTGNVKEDCIAKNKICEDGQCKTPKPKKQLKCGTNCWAYADHCKDMTDACKAYCPGTEGYYKCLGEPGDRYGRCYRWSDCSASPSCGGDIYLGEEQSC